MAGIIRVVCVLDCFQPIIMKRRLDKKGEIHCSIVVKFFECSIVLLLSYLSVL